MTNSLILNAQEFFIYRHDVHCNHFYDEENQIKYSFHLNAVFKQCQYFKYLLSDEEFFICAITSFGHDSIEDARLTYNDIKDRFGQRIADVIYLCTEYVGRNRRERKPTAFYEKLKTDELALFTKLCDNIANIKYSLLANSSKLNMYKEEYIKNKPIIYTERFKDIFEYIEKLLIINIK